jgi:hypothetical protein
VVFVPLLDTISTHPFSPTEERMWDVIKG